MPSDENDFSITNNTNLHLVAPLLLDSPIAGVAGHLPLQHLLYKLWIACHGLQLDPETRFTSLVLLHRYYAHEKEQNDSTAPDDNYKWIGAACLILGMKAEEQSRRLRDVINMAHMLDFSLSSSSNGVIDVSSDPPDLNEDYWKAKEQIVKTEQAVLRVLQFDTIVSHPHRLVVLLLQQLNLPVEGSNSCHDDVVSAAWTRLNDALFHAPALTHTALTLACAAIVLVNTDEDATIELMGDQVGDVRAAMKDLREATEELKN